MKKFTLFLAGIVSATMLHAQGYDTFEFVNAQGASVPDGTTLTVTEITPEEDPETGEVINMMLPGLSVRNKSQTEASLRVHVGLSRMDNGMYQICFPVACLVYNAAGNYITPAGSMTAGEVRSLLTEWITMGQGGCDVSLSIEVMQQQGSFPNFQYVHLADGPTVMVHLRNGINDVVPGDVNGDGKVDLMDINIIINIMLGKDSSDNYDGRANVNGLGGVDLADINAVINIMLGK